MSDEAMTKLFQCPHCEGEGSFDAATGQVDNDTGTQFMGPVKCGHCQGTGLAYGIVVHRLTELARAADDDDAYLVMLIQDACAIIELQARKLAKQRRAQSAGEALDPAVAKRLKSLEALHHHLGYSHTLDHVDRENIQKTIDLIRAQASALAEARKNEADWCYRRAETLRLAGEAATNPAEASRMHARAIEANSIAAMIRSGLAARALT